jgi:hypothetical protein
MFHVKHPAKKGLPSHAAPPAMFHVKPLSPARFGHGPRFDVSREAFLRKARLIPILFAPAPD